MSARNGKRQRKWISEHRLPLFFSKILVKNPLGETKFEQKERYKYSYQSYKLIKVNFLMPKLLTVLTSFLEHRQYT